MITSKLSERSIEFADLITERGKILNPEYNICRDQPTSRASPLRINDLLSTVVYFGDASEQCFLKHRIVNTQSGSITMSTFDTAIFALRYLAEANWALVIIACQQFEF